jgi:hypothetical protein
MEIKRDEIEGWKQNPWSKLPTWGKWTVGIVGSLLLLGIGGAIGSDEGDIKSKLAEATKERDEAKQEAEAITTRRTQILAEAQATAARIVSNSKAEHSQLAEELRRERDELGAVESELSNAESSLAGAEEEKRLSSFNDGTWRSGVDYEPGTYEAPGGAECYWAKLSAPSGEGIEGIIDNGGFNKHQIVSVDSPYFETRGCGNWTRIGE